MVIHLKKIHSFLSFSFESRFYIVVSWSWLLLSRTSQIRSLFISQSMFITNYLLIPTFIIQHLIYRILSRSRNALLFVVKWLPIILVDSNRLILGVIGHLRIVIPRAWNVRSLYPWLVSLRHRKLGHLCHRFDMVWSWTRNTFTILQSFSCWIS